MEVIRELHENSEAAHCSAMKRMILSKVPSDRYTRHSAVWTYTRQSRRRQPSPAHSKKLCLGIYVTKSEDKEFSVVYSV